ncbi:MAG: dTMP kinase [Chloroflexi bacterium]|nr:dTMP kinase [Chloroflexota bacterium]
MLLGGALSLFISFEGGEGSGKSTQAEMLQKRLLGEHYQSLFLHEPGTTPLGRHMRDLLKGRPWGGEKISHGAELFMFAAARAELVAKVIKPLMRQQRDIIIIADRYADSTIAYQGYGRRMPIEELVTVNHLATQGVLPDITFLLDCAPEEGLKRVGELQTILPLDVANEASGGRVDKEGATRFEEESIEFHERVRTGYLKIAKKKPERFFVIDATSTIDKIAEQIWSIVSEKLPGPSDAGPPELKLEFPA